MSAWWASTILSHTSGGSPPERCRGWSWAWAAIRRPRCSGKGGSPAWRPDAGVCYRCKGEGQVNIDVERYLKVLRFLRRRYAAIRHSSDPEAREELAYVEADGRRVRAALEAAGVPVPSR